MADVVKYVNKIGCFLGLIFICLCLMDCLGLFYFGMTHLTKKDLVWTNGLNQYKTATFVSNKGNTSKLNISGITVYNETNPFYISTASHRYYEANAWCDIEVEDSTRILEGSYSVKRKIGNDSLMISGHLGAAFCLEYFPIVPVTYQIGDKIIDNCVIFDTINAPNSKHWKNKPEQKMEKFVISRDYGLIYYRLYDGEEFTRVF
ncbi:MAG: hypothetical protein NC098_06830 [Lachnoclostridium sp.]|nr:hypothetical protein [Lachnoclostridium sp.]